MLKFNVNMMVFGGGYFGRCLDPEGGALVNRISALWRWPKKIPHPFGHAGDSFSPDTQPAASMILDFQPPELREVNVCF